MKKTIDWSCKHNVLIRNADGTFSPMDEPYYESEPVTRDVWKIFSSGDFSYCIRGKTKGVSIDTGYGAGNLREYLEKLIGLPVPDVINTHDHFDHTANNGYFDHAYMGTKSIPLATIPFKSFSGIDFITDYERIGVGDGDVYRLDDKEIEFFDIPDHAAGSIAILDRADRVLFTGDEFMPMGKVMGLATVTEFLGYTEKLLKRKKDFDLICTGNGVFPPSFLQGFHDCAAYIISGHEGELYHQDFPHPKPLPDSPDGKTVYDRKMPHFGDGGAGMLGVSKTQLRVMEYAGTRIIYDEKRL